jgi:excisionase family DNA binding protein
MSKPTTEPSQKELADKALALSNAMPPAQHTCLTITIPEAAHRLGIGRNQGYECARRGEIPTIRLGKRKVVPLAAFEAMLAVQSKQQIVATELVRRLQHEAAE